MLLRHVSAQVPKDCRKGIGYSSIETYREVLEIAILTAKREENATRINFSRMFSCVNVKWLRYKSIEQPRDEMVVWSVVSSQGGLGLNDHHVSIRHASIPY